MKRLPTRTTRVSPALIVAMLALLVAVGGSADAAKRLITGRDIKNGSITGLDIRNKSITAADVRGRLSGQRGLPGAKGDKGDKGDKGETGASGATGSALLTGQATSLPEVVGTSLTHYRRAAVNGVSTGATSPPEVASLVPGRNLVARDLRVRVFNDVADGGDVAVTLMQNPSGSFGESFLVPTLGCVIAGTPSTDDKTCSAPGPIVLSAGAVIFMRIEIGGSAAGTNPDRAYWGITVEPG